MGRRLRHGALVILFCALQLLITFADGSTFSLRAGGPSVLSRVPRAVESYHRPSFHVMNTNDSSNCTANSSTSSNDSSNSNCTTPNTTVIPPYPGLDTNPCAFIIGTSDTRNSVRGFFAAFFLTGSLVALGIGLTWWNYRNNRWDHVNFERIPLYKSLKMKRSRADWFRLLTLLVDTIQILALVLCGNYVFNFWGSGDGSGTGLSFNLLHTEYPRNVYNIPKAVLKLFLWDFDEIGFWVTPSEYNETFFAVVKFCIFVCFGFFFLCAAIYSQVEFILNRFPIGRMFVNTFSLIGPFISDWCFIPVMYNFLATFNCMKERRFFDRPNDDWSGFVARDCPATCWEGDHMNHVAVAIVGILLYYPWAIYTRPVWQMLPDSLTLRDQPRFVILTIHWKLLLVACHAFLSQFPIAHALGYFILTGGMLYFSVKWEPTTVPYFDLICLTAKAVTFWASISVVCGLFLPGFVTFLLLGIGEGLILAEFFLMNGTNMGDTGGKYAPDSIDWHKHQEWLKRQKLLEQNEKRRRLEKVAEYRHELMTASDPRLVQAPESGVLSGSIKIKEEGTSSAAEVEDNDEPLVFKDTITGQHVRVLPIKNRNTTAAPAMKVMGLKLEAKIPSQTPMSFQFRPDDPERGTLLIMRSPDMSLYSYLQMKLNAYHAYYRAFEMDPAVAVEAEKRAKALAMGKDPNRVDKKKSKDKKVKKEKKGSGKDGKETKEERKARKDREKKEKEDAKKKKKDKKTRKSSVPTDINLLKSRHKYLTVLRGPSVNIMPEKVVQVEEPVAPYKRVNNGSLLAIAQNIGPDFRSFQSNISQHAASLSSWIAARRASPAAIGAELCAVFGIEPYSETVIIEVPDERNALLQAKVKELEASLENMEKELEDRMTNLVQREYNKGVADGRKKKREIALEAAKQKAGK